MGNKINGGKWKKPFEFKYDGVNKEIASKEDKIIQLIFLRKLTSSRNTHREYEKYKKTKRGQEEKLNYGDYLKKRVGELIGKHNKGVEEKIAKETEYHKERQGKNSKNDSKNFNPKFSSK